MKKIRQLGMYLVEICKVLKSMSHRITVNVVAEEDEKSDQRWPINNKKSMILQMNDITNEWYYKQIHIDEGEHMSMDYPLKN